MKTYKGALTLPDSNAANLLTLLNAAGFTMTPMADEVTVVAGSGALTVGSTSALAATGIPIAVNATFVERSGKQAIDLKAFWVKAAATTTFYVNVRGI